MLVDAAAPVAGDLAGVEAAAIAAEAAGYDGFGVPETRHDPFTGLTLAARATARSRCSPPSRSPSPGTR